MDSRYSYCLRINGGDHIMLMSCFLFFDGSDLASLIVKRSVIRIGQLLISRLSFVFRNASFNNV